MEKTIIDTVQWQLLVQGLVGKGYKMLLFLVLEQIMSLRVKRILSSVLLQKNGGFRKPPVSWSIYVYHRKNIYCCGKAALTIQQDLRLFRWHVFLYHFAVNIGMNIGFAPVIGIPLPFFSYGGSSMLSFSIMVFILLKLDSQRRHVLR